MSSKLLTIEDIKMVVPKRVHKSIDEKILNTISTLGKDTGVQQEDIEELLKRTVSCLSGSSATSMPRFLDALKFVTLRQRMSNENAWKITFPDRYERTVKEGKEKNISAMVSMYNKGELVNEIESSLIIDFNTFYMGARHEAMQKNIALMRGQAAPSLVPTFEKNEKTGKYEQIFDRHGEPVMDKVYMKVSPKVQQDASKVILEITQPNEDKNINIKFGLSDEAIEQQKDTADAMRALAMQQRETMLSGGKITDVQVIGNALAGSNEVNDDTQ